MKRPYLVLVKMPHLPMAAAHTMRDLLVFPRRLPILTQSYDLHGLSGGEFHVFEGKRSPAKDADYDVLHILNGYGADETSSVTFWEADAVIIDGKRRELCTCDGGGGIVHTPSSTCTSGPYYNPFKTVVI